jgi:glyoxylase-like metal-dependent hydrolase (beta-lactamase superfamily II)
MKERLLLAPVAIALIITTGFFRADPVRSAPKAEDDFQLIQVAEGIYAAIASAGGVASGNAGFIIGDDGVLVFDTFLTPAAIEELIGEIQARTKLPIKYAVNSHYHLDHTGGNQVLLARGVPIIAHDNLIKWRPPGIEDFCPSPQNSRSDGPMPRSS